MSSPSEFLERVVKKARKGHVNLNEEQYDFLMDAPEDGNAELWREFEEKKRKGKIDTP